MSGTRAPSPRTITSPPLNSGLISPSCLAPTTPNLASQTFRPTHKIRSITKNQTRSPPMRMDITSPMKVVMNSSPRRGAANTMMCRIGRGANLIRKRKRMTTLFRTGPRALCRAPPIASPHSPPLSPLHIPLLSPLCSLNPGL